MLAGRLHGRWWPRPLGSAVTCHPSQAPGPWVHHSLGTSRGAARAQIGGCRAALRPGQSCPLHFLRLFQAWYLVRARACALRDHPRDCGVDDWTELNETDTDSPSTNLCHPLESSRHACVQMHRHARVFVLRHHWRLGSLRAWWKLVLTQHTTLS